MRGRFETVVRKTAANVDRCVNGLHFWPDCARPGAKRSCRYCDRYSNWLYYRRNPRVSAPFCARGHEPAPANVARIFKRNAEGRLIVAVVCRACDLSRKALSRYVRRRRARGVAVTVAEMTAYADHKAALLYRRYSVSETPAVKIPPPVRVDGRREPVLDLVDPALGLQVLRYADSSLFFRGGVAVAAERGGDVYVLRATAPAASQCEAALFSVYPHGKIVHMDDHDECVEVAAAFFGRTPFGDVRLRTILKAAKRKADRQAERTE